MASSGSTGAGATKGGASAATPSMATDLAIIANRTAAFDADATATRFGGGSSGGNEAGNLGHSVTVDVTSFSAPAAVAQKPRRKSDPAVVVPNELSAAVSSKSRNPLLRSKYRAFQHRRRAGHKMTFLGGTQPNPAAGSSSGSDDAAAAAAGALATGALEPSLAAVAETTSGDAADEEEDEELGEYWDPITDVPETRGDKAWFFSVWIWYLAYKLTIPDCRFEKFKNPKGFWSCFVMSIVWIGAQCFAITWLIERIGCIFHAPHTLMALTVVAAGTSVPDALASVLVARSGQGDMAVSNAIGSNVFDIMLGCGIPFFISTLIYDKDVPVKTDKLMASIYILFGIVVAVIGTIHFSGWKLTPTVGWILFLLYFAYVAFAYVYGLS